MMLHMCDEHHRPFLGREFETFPVLLWNAQTKDPLEFVDGRCHAEADVEQHIVRPGMRMLLDDRLCMMIRLRHRRAGDIRFGMCVADERPERLEQGAFDRPVEATARGPVNIEDGSISNWRVERLVYSDDVSAETVKCRLK